MEYVFPTYARYPIDIVDGEDVHLVDSQGQQYLDFTSGIGVCSFGYSNQLIKDSVATQAGKVWHTSNLYDSQLQDQVAAKLVEPGMLAFFCNSGTEANEAALKLARKASGKTKVIAFNDSFHGRTYGSLSMTGNPGIKEGFFPLVPSIEFADFDDDAALTQIDNQTAAVILEVIQGEGGVNNAHADWLQAVETKAHQVGAMLIIDEVQTGIGRTGTKFAYQNYDLHPDIVTLAKALGNGLPIGAMIGKQELASAFGPGSHGTTFGGNKLSLAAADAVLDQLTPEFLTAVQAKSKSVWAILKNEIAQQSIVTAISGQGLMIGIHLDEQVNVEDIVKALQQDGLLTLSAKHNTLRLLPPLVMSTEELTTGLTKINQVLSQFAQTKMEAKS